jgi:hypothetical protein
MKACARKALRLLQHRTEEAPLSVSMVSHPIWSSSINMARPMVNIVRVDLGAKEGFFMESFE